MGDPFAVTVLLTGVSTIGLIVFYVEKPEVWRRIVRRINPDLVAEEGLKMISKEITLRVQKGDIIG